MLLKERFLEDPKFLKDFQKINFSCIADTIEELVYFYINDEIDKKNEDLIEFCNAVNQLNSKMQQINQIKNEIEMELELAAIDRISKEEIVFEKEYYETMKKQNILESEK